MDFEKVKAYYSELVKAHIFIKIFCIICVSLSVTTTPWLDAVGFWNVSGRFAVNRIYLSCSLYTWNVCKRVLNPNLTLIPKIINIHPEQRTTICCTWFTTLIACFETNVYFSYFLSYGRQRDLAYGGIRTVKAHSRQSSRVNSSLCSCLGKFAGDLQLKWRHPTVRLTI